MSLSGDDSALLIPVPEAEEVVGSFRRQHDPSALKGIPAHVTLVYPFFPPDEIDRDLQRDLGALFRDRPCFDVVFSRVRRFTNTLWLEPEPADTFTALIEDILRRYPSLEPYGGQVDAIVPHLTLADKLPHGDLDDRERAFLDAAGRDLPITTRVEEAWIMIGDEGGWNRRISLPFHTDS